MDPYAFPYEKVTNEKKRNRSKGILKTTKFVVRNKKYLIEMNFEEILERMISWLKIIHPSLTDKQLSGHAFKQLGLPHIMGTLSCINLKKELRKRNGKIDLNLIDPLLLVNFSKKIRIFVRKATEKRCTRIFPNMDNLPELNNTEMKNKNVPPVDEQDHTDKDDGSEIIANEECNLEVNDELPSEYEDTFDNESLNSGAIYRELCYSREQNYSSDEEDCGIKPWRTAHLRDIESISPIKFMKELNYLNISYKCTTPLIFQDIETTDENYSTISEEETDSVSYPVSNSSGSNQDTNNIEILENNWSESIDCSSLVVETKNTILYEKRNYENVIEEVTPKSYKKSLHKKVNVPTDNISSPILKLGEEQYHENSVSKETLIEENIIAPKVLKHKLINSPIEVTSEVNTPSTCTEQNYENEKIPKTNRRLSLRKKQPNIPITDELPDDETQPSTAKLPRIQNITTTENIVIENKEVPSKSIKKKLSLKKQKLNEKSFETNLVTETPKVSEIENFETITKEKIPSTVIIENMPECTEEQIYEPEIAEKNSVVENEELPLQPLKKKLNLSKKQSMAQSIDDSPEKEEKSSNVKGRKGKVSDAQTIGTKENLVAEVEEVPLKKRLGLKKQKLNEAKSYETDVITITDSSKVNEKQNFESSAIVKTLSPVTTENISEITEEQIDEPEIVMENSVFEITELQSKSKLSLRKKQYKTKFIDDAPSEEEKSSNNTKGHKAKVSDAKHFESVIEEISLKRQLSLKKQKLSVPKVFETVVDTNSLSKKIVQIETDTNDISRSSPMITENIPELTEEQNYETEDIIFEKEKISKEFKKKLRRRREQSDEKINRRVSDGIIDNYEQLIENENVIIEETSMIQEQDSFEFTEETPMRKSCKTKVSTAIELQHYEQKKHKISDASYSKSVEDLNKSKISEDVLFIKPKSTKSIASTIDSIKYIGVKKRKNIKRTIEESSYIGESICTEFDNALMEKLPPPTTSASSELDSIYKGFNPLKRRKKSSNIKRIAVNSLPKEDSMSKVCRYLQNLPGTGSLSTEVFNSSQSTDDESNAPSSSCGSVLRRALDTDADSE